MKRDTGLKFPAQQLFHLADHSRCDPGWRSGRVRRLFFGILRNIWPTGLHSPFYFAHGKSAGDNFAGEVGDCPFGAQPQQRARVSGRELLFLKEPTDRGGKLKQTKSVGDRRTVFANNVGDFLLGKQKFFDQSLVAVGLFDRIEIGPLKILNHCKGERSAIIGRANHSRDLSPAKSGCSPEATLTGDELVAVPVRRWPHRNGLEQSVHAQA